MSGSASISTQTTAQTTQITTTPLPSNHLEAMSEYTLVAKYARWIEKKKRRETWDEMVNRVRDMHIFRYASKNIEEDIRWSFEQVRNKKVLPSMRSMQYGGDSIIANDARIYNCSYSVCDRPRFFSECLWLLLSGVGVGFSVQKQHIEKLPNLIPLLDSTEKEVMTYTIRDTIEGWADALQILVDSLFSGTPISGKEVFFDYTKIRRKGARLRTSGGRAPGPKPLQIALKKIKRVLLDAIEANQTKLKPIQVYDIITMSADCVLAGGIRRSATIALFSLDDEEMMKAKTEFHQNIKILTDKRNDGTWLTDVGVAYNLKMNKNNDVAEPKKGDICDIGWYNLYPWRQMSNNSVAIKRDDCKFEDFQKIINHSKSYGEPGFIFLNDLNYGYNPCSEIGISTKDKRTGQSGFGLCNLTEINGGAIKTIEDFKNAIKAATIIGTLQSGYTYLNYLTDASRNIVRDESLLGVSVTGWMDNPKLLLKSDVQQEMAKYAIEINKEFAKKIGINPAARVTCSKPSGTTSIIFGTGSGIHPHHSRRYFRRVRCNKVEAPGQFFQLHNPHMIEDSVSNKNDYVITFCIQVPELAILKKDLSAIDFLKMVKSTYENWVVPGTARPDSAPGLNHNVSNTVTVKPNEWDEVTKFIYDNKECFSGISLIADFGEKIYAQVPFEKVETEEDIKKWNEIVNNYRPVDWSKLEELDDDTSLNMTVACGAGGCELK
jgi:ribonucleoside-diphosphate reductase alpha chain